MNAKSGPAVRTLLAALLLAGALAHPVLGQEWMTGDVGSLLEVIPGSDCEPLATWMNPTLFVDAAGNLRLVAHAARPPYGVPPDLDHYYSATRSPSGAWTTPGTNAPAYLFGGYTRCGYGPGNPGPIGDLDVVKAGNRYYMAFNGGNADFIVGRTYWAVSSDGVSWSVYDVNPPPGEIWAPLVRPRDHECLNGANMPPTTWNDIPGGITEQYLAFEPSDHSMGPNGTFYLYLGHYDLRPRHPSYAIDSWVIRFGHEPTNRFGIGSTRQIWHDGTWKPFDSGTMVWSFDGLPAVPGEPLLSPHQGENPAGPFFGAGGGALRKNSVTGEWLHVVTHSDDQNFEDDTSSQRATSLAANLWTPLSTVDLQSVIEETLPSPPNDPFDVLWAGLHFGAGGNRTGWWLYPSVNPHGCTQPFHGLEIVPAELCTTAAPTLGTISPATGSSAGGTIVSISGTGLDCASSVKFGGTSAPITSRSSGLVQVTTPPHAAGAVTVEATTPAGTATRANGFTYTAPPAYAGYHDGIDCNVTFGWAWDANHPATRLNVDLYDGSVLLGSALANIYRPDLEAAGIGDGRYGFGFNLPASVRDGNLHTIYAKFGGTATLLGTTPKTIQCSPPVTPQVSIAATDPEAFESPANPGQFTLTRTGSTSATLTVTIARSGTATNGSDYVSIPLTHTFGIGQSTKPVPVTPIDDTQVELPETVVLTVVAGSGYQVGTPSNATVTITSNDFVACVPSATRLCLGGGRFEATLAAVNNGNNYTGRVLSSSTQAGYFWLFSPSLAEVGLKVLDNGNGTFSATYGASTDSATTLTVRDLASQRVRTYTKPAGSFCGGTENQAFPLTAPSWQELGDLTSDGDAESAFTCVPDSTTHCLLGNRFRVRARVGTTYQTATPLTGQSGAFSFAAASAPHLFVNLIDGTPVNGKYWVYFGSLASQAFTVEITDSQTEQTRTYSRTTGQPYCGGGDVNAF